MNKGSVILSSYIFMYRVPEYLDISLFPKEIIASALKCEGEGVLLIFSSAFFSTLKAIEILSNGPKYSLKIWYGSMS